MHNKMSTTDIPGAVRVSTTLDTEVGHKGGVDITLLHLGGGSPDRGEGGGGENEDGGELHDDDVWEGECGVVRQTRKSATGTKRRARRKKGKVVQIRAA